MSKHVPGLQFLNQLMSDVPALSAEASYYQRVIAGDQAEAAEVIDRYVKEEASDSVYDAMLVPALNYAERDRIEERLLPHEEAAVTETTSELLELLSEGQQVPVNRDGSLRVLGYAVNGNADELALRMKTIRAGCSPMR